MLDSARKPFGKLWVKPLIHYVCDTQKLGVRRGVRSHPHEPSTVGDLGNDGRGGRRGKGHGTPDQELESEIDAIVAALEPIEDVKLSRCLLRGARRERRCETSWKW